MILDYTPADFIEAYPEPRFQLLDQVVVQRCIDIVSALYQKFQDYPEEYSSILWGLATAHELEVSGAVGGDTAPWFANTLSSVKSLNDAVTFKQGTDDLDTTNYGTQLRKLLVRIKPPQLFYSGYGFGSIVSGESYSGYQ